MNVIELVQAIGDEVCEGCSDDADCGENPEGCDRIKSAVAMVDSYINDETKS